MNVFELRNHLVADYADYIRGFINISDERIRECVDEELQAGNRRTEWPANSEAQGGCSLRSPVNRLSVENWEVSKPPQPNEGEPCELGVGEYGAEIRRPSPYHSATVAIRSYLSRTTLRANSIPGPEMRSE